MRRSIACRLSLFAPILLACCGDRTNSNGSAASDVAATAKTAAPFAPMVLEHNFGIVPHGEQRQHEFLLDLASLGNLVPLRVHLECSCGRADVRMRAADGSERFVDGTGYARNLPGVGEKAILHVELDTQKREPIDLPLTTSHGYVMLQPIDDDTGLARVRWPFVLHFGVDAPIELQPFATLDFGRVPISQQAEVITALRGDQQHREARFTAIHASDPNLTVSLEPADDRLLVRAICRPDRLGNHRALVTIDTDIAGYLLTLEATWKVVPDLEAVPIAKVSVSAALDRPQADDAGMRQFVLLTDHDLRRSPEFVAAEIVGDDGRDASSCFAVTFAPVPGQDRQQRMSLRYLGGLTGPFRGKIVLTKTDGGPELPIELVLLPARTP